jgi:hypothetical protein
LDEISDVAHLVEMLRAMDTDAQRALMDRIRTTHPQTLPSWSVSSRSSPRSVGARTTAATGAASSQSLVVVPHRRSAALGGDRSWTVRTCAATAHAAASTPGRSR